MDQLTAGILSLTTTRYHPTRLDVEHAKMIKDVIVRHLVALTAPNPPHHERFRDDYLRCSMLSWGFTV
jgi:hypothetical protein